MRCIGYTLSLLLCLTLSPKAFPTKVGFTQIQTVDKNRRHWRGTGDRPLLLDLYYPTSTQTVTHWSSARFNYGDLARQAAVIPKPHPLILLSHGSRSHSGQLLWLIQALVQAGYVVAAVNHHGNTSMEPTFYDAAETLWWERAADLKAALIKLQQDAHWSKYIAFDHLGLIGFSIGGHTVLSNLGAITDTHLFHQACSTQPTQFLCAIDEDNQKRIAKRHQNHPAEKAVYQQALAQMQTNYGLPQVRAAFVMAPAYTTAFTPSSLRAIQTPILAMIGDNDTRIHRQHASLTLRQNLPSSHVIELKQVQHYSFLSECTLQGRLFDWQYGFCHEHPNTDRNALHQAIAQKVVVFFHAHIDKKQ